MIYLVRFTGLFLHLNYKKVMYTFITYPPMCSVHAFLPLEMYVHVLKRLRGCLYWAKEYFYHEYFPSLPLPDLIIVSTMAATLICKCKMHCMICKP